MKFRTIITEENGIIIIDTGLLLENTKIVYQIDNQEVVVENKVENKTITE